jgi:hypothetical protein
MAEMGLRRRDQYWCADSVYVNTTAVHSLISQRILRIFENSLNTIRDVGFQTYEDGDRLPDGRVQA